MLKQKAIYLLFITMLFLAVRTVAAPYPGSTAVVPLFGDHDFGYFLDVKEGTGCLSAADVFLPCTLPNSSPYYIEPSNSYRLLLHLSTGNSSIAGPKAPGVLKPYDPGPLIGDKLEVQYGDGHIHGTLFDASFCLEGTDRSAVTAPFLSIDARSTPYLGYDNDYDGLAAMAYTALSEPDGNTSSLLDALIDQWGLANEFSLHLCRHRYDLYQEENPENGHINACNIPDNPQGGILVIGDGGLPEGLSPNHPQKPDCITEDSNPQSRRSADSKVNSESWSLLHTVADRRTTGPLSGPGYRNRSHYVEPREHSLFEPSGFMSMLDRSITKRESPDSSQGSGDIRTLFFTGIVREKFYEVLISDIKVDDDSVAMDCREFNTPATILDTATAGIILPGKVHHKVRSMLQKAAKPTDGFTIPANFWNGSGRIIVPYTVNLSEVFPTLSFIFALDDNDSKGFSLNLPPEVYLRQEYPKDQPGCKSFYCRYFSLGIESGKEGSILGLPVISAYHVKVDRSHKKIGFGPSQCLMDSLHAYGKTSITSDIPLSGKSCSATTENDEKALTYIPIAIGSFAVLVLFVAASAKAVKYYYQSTGGKS